jgi:hypothetical protein
MKNWQIAVLCFSIIISVAASTFYIKYEPKTLLTTNYGPVNLGKVFSEKVMVDVTLIDNMGDDDEELITAYSFYDKTEPVDKVLVNLADKYNIGKEEKNKLKYDELSPVNNDAFKLKIRTYINYLSSNFANTPYTLTVSEQEYRLPATETLKKTIDSAIETNFKTQKEEVVNHLFITDKVAFGLKEENVSDK